MERDFTFYLSKGFDRSMVEYFASGRKRIIAVSPNKDFTLILDFDNGERRLLDCKPFLQIGTVFTPFLQFENFQRVYLNREHCVSWDIDPNIDSEVVWNNKIDLCPDRCYVDSILLQGGAESA